MLHHNVHEGWFLSSSPRLNYYCLPLVDVSFHKTLPQEWANLVLFPDDYPGKWQYIYPWLDRMLTIMRGKMQFVYPLADWMFSNKLKSVHYLCWGKREKITTFGYKRGTICSTANRISRIGICASKRGLGFGLFPRNRWKKFAANIKQHKIAWENSLNDPPESLYPVFQFPYSHSHFEMENWIRGTTKSVRVETVEL